MDKSIPLHETHGANQTANDLEIWQRLDSLVQRQDHPLRHILELFPAYVRRYHFKRFLTHYELLKMTTEVPGSIFEFGVYRAASLLTWGKLMDILLPLDRTKRIYGFDSFKGLHDFDEDKDGKLVPEVGKTISGWSAQSVQDEVEELIAIANDDGVFKSKRIQLIVGDLFETLPKFLEENPGIRVSLLHLDVDLYKPTKFVLEHLYSRIPKGGVIVFDEYGLVPWEGESNAADDFFKEIGVTPNIKKFPFSTFPGGYIVK
jgi:hypothetical protein